MLSLHRVVAALLTVFPLSLYASTMTDSKERLNATILLDVQRSELNNRYPNWLDKSVQLKIRTPDSRQLSVEFSEQYHFNHTGQLLALNYMQDHGQYSFSNIAYSYSTGAFFLPARRIDAFWYQKLLPAKNMIASAGITYNESKDEHRDSAFQIGLTYYLNSNWIIDIAHRTNGSNPGLVIARRTLYTATFYLYKRQEFSFHVDDGKEAYQITGQDSDINDFNSREATLSWTHWLTREQGFRLQLGHYHNPHYRRKTVKLGIFREF